MDRQKIIARNKRRRELYAEKKQIKKINGDAELLCARSNNKLAFEDNFANGTEEVVGGAGVEENISAHRNKRRRELPSGCSNVVVPFDVGETLSQNFDVDTHNSLCDVRVCAPNSTIHFHGNNLLFTHDRKEQADDVEKYPFHAEESHTNGLCIEARRKYPDHPNVNTNFIPCKPIIGNQYCATSFPSSSENANASTPLSQPHGTIHGSSFGRKKKALAAVRVAPQEIANRLRKQLGRTKRNQKTDWGKLPIEAHLLNTPTVCKHCSAIKFQFESKGFCCCSGEVQLQIYGAHPDLYELFTSASDEARLFMRNIRAYNSNFAFTSFGAKHDKDLCSGEKGIYTFRVQGQVYHSIGQLVPNKQPPSFLQLYFYDTDHELSNRLSFSNNMTTVMIDKLTSLLMVNPYCQFFRSLTDVPNLDSLKIQIKSDPKLDQRVFNEPTVSQVAAIWIDSDPSAEYSPRDIIVSAHNGGTHKIHYCFGCYDPLQYPLLFLYGSLGWHQGIEKLPKQKTNVPSAIEDFIDARQIDSVDELLTKETIVLESVTKRPCVSCREYYCYRLQIRPAHQSLLLHAGRLLQQYAVDMYVKVETSRLDYFRTRQEEIRSDLYQGIVDTIGMGETRGYKAGKRIILSGSFNGGPRDMRRRYMDGMALVQRFGKPDIFLTITCNPNWLEIKDILGEADEVQNRPDLVARVFRAKLEELKTDLLKRLLFGHVAAYVYVIEFQKRGLPHAHFLLIPASGDRLLTPEKFDKFVSAEIPDNQEFSYLHSVVVKHMMHGPCGALNRKNICMQTGGQCKSHYPRAFTNQTQIGDDSFPIYRRRKDNRKVKVRGHYLDNRWVVPYNPYLLAKFDCHLNVEICSTIKAVKYLYKYVYKGHDRVYFSVAPDSIEKSVNEIDIFQSGRWISPPEAMWRIYGFILNEIYPSVISLQLHLEGDQLVTFRKNDDLTRVVANPFAAKSMLTEFFFMNRSASKTKNLLYREFPQHYVWNKRYKIWTERKRGEVIGRIVTANPLEGERYYLRVLLNHIRSPTSYAYLKTVNGIHDKTFREAAMLHGLLDGDSNFELCMEEACSYQMPFELCRLFATILAFCGPNDPNQLWIKFKRAMCEDYLRNKIPLATIELKALQSINFFLEPMGKTVNDYGLVSFKVDLQMHEKITQIINEELELEISASDRQAITNLNPEQKIAFDLIMEKVLSDQGGLFFIDGPGGTGKTYLYRALLASIRDRKLIALATASSGVAAGILPGGRTAHSRFKISLQLNDHAGCNVRKQSALASLLQMSKLIIWDEAPMVHRQAIESLDTMLRDVIESDSPFGGKVVVLGGDFRQILPVIQRGQKEDVVKASLVNSYLWKSFTRIKLTTNMRARLDPTFSNYLLRVGNGEEECDSLNNIQLPGNMIIPFVDEDLSMQQLLDIGFPNIAAYPQNMQSAINRVILTPKNDYVDKINNALLTRFPGDEVVYYSFDESLDKTEQTLQEDFLNAMTPSGIPPHQLILKKNCPIMLLRNINPAEGLCNGTRLVCREFGRNVIDAEIATGDHFGKRVFLPRIPFIPLQNDHDPFAFKRTQFPVRPCFAMTINKAQGQTLDFVGLYLPEPVFSHGQLYVALSRARTTDCIKILLRPDIDDPNSSAKTKNIVYHDLLALANDPLLPATYA